MEHSSTPPEDGSHDQYVTFGYFDPLLARRITKRLGEEAIRYDVVDTSRLDMADAGIVDSVTPLTRRPKLARLNRVELFIHGDDVEKAQKTVDQI